MSTDPLRTRHHIGQRHGDGQLSLVAHHGDELDEPLEAVCQHRLGQRVELGALLQDLGEDLHEGGAGLQVLVVAQTWHRTAKRKKRGSGGGVISNNANPVNVIFLMRMKR